jgi:hypothetical protein
MSYMPHVPCCEHEFGHPAIASGASAAAIVSIAVVFIVGEQRSTVANVNAQGAAARERSAERRPGKTVGPPGSSPGKAYFYW